MNDSDSGGGGYSGTNWNAHDVRQMWSLLAGQQTDPHWKLVAGWRKTFELTSLHLSRLKDYREKLAQAWPPERNAASKAYVAHLDYLIGHVQQTYDAAVANYDAFAGATGALSTTRVELKKLYDEYQTNQTKLDQYATVVAAAKDPANSGLPQPTPGPSPVPTGRQEELNNKARTLMYGLSGELMQARVAIRQPPPYKPPGVKYSENPKDPTDTGGGGGGGITVPPPPVIPPVVPTPTPTFTPTPQTTIVQPTVTGPTLTGITTLNPPITTTLPPPTVVPPPTTGIIGPTPPPIAPPMPRPPANGIIGNPIPGPTPVAKPGTGTAMSLPRTAPPGGIIGGPGHSVTGHPMAGQAGGRPVGQRVNPVGGMIGQAPGGRAPGVGPHAGGQGARPGAARGGAPGQAFGTAPTGRGQRRAEEEQEQERRWDPDNPWETAEGVSPVVLPPAATGRVDPGPAIGFDR
jgi:hypothetical protein